MRKVFVLLLIATLAAGAAFAHGGMSHHLLGTIKVLSKDHLVVKDPDGHEVLVALTASTQYEWKDRKAAKKSDLATGVRVSIQLSEDNKSAVKVKIGTAAK